MPHLTDLITDLVAATEQMKPMAQANDWEMVERLQKRRRVLIEAILEQAERETLSEDDAERLREVRRQETTVAALASARRQALSEAIAQTQTGVRVDKHRRIRRAYGDGEGA